MGFNGTSPRHKSWTRAAHDRVSQMGSDDSRIAGNLLPDVPTMLKLPTLPRLRRSKRQSPTTPTFLSEPLGAPPTKPVVYSPVPTYVDDQHGKLFVSTGQHTISTLRGGGLSGKGRFSPVGTAENWFIGDGVTGAWASP